jgi:hypothetical protein
VNPPSTNRNPFTFKDTEEFNRTFEEGKWSSKNLLMLKIYLLLTPWKGFFNKVKKSNSHLVIIQILIVNKAQQIHSDSSVRKIIAHN